MRYLAQSYESHMVPSLFAPWAQELVERATPQRGEHVLDIACGTGIVARTAATLVGIQGMVIGVDINPDMIAIARASAERNHLAIEWRAGPAEQLPFADEHFDLVLCQFGLMFFTDRSAALREMHRVVRTGGRVLLSVWQGLERHPFYQSLHDVSRKHFGKSSVEAVFSLGDADELSQLLIASGFQQLRIEPVSLTARFPRPEEFLAWEMDVDPATTPALRHLDHEAQQAILAAARRDMQIPLDAVTQDGQAIIEFHANIAQTRR